MTDTLRGLGYMHSLGSGPIAHGDIKLSNILVNSDETALICDFGRSCQSNDESNEVILSSSSPFAGTVRYMSPELLDPDSARPSLAADMWAYGCVALEVLCRIQPYHEITSDVVVAELIRSGQPPSDRPRGPRGSLINDALWSVLSSCWQAQDWRPTAHGFLEELNRMLHRGEVPRSPALMNVFTNVGSEPIPPWPEDIPDLDGELGSSSLITLSLIQYFKEKVVMQEKYTRSIDPYPTTHSLMCDVLEGLKYMHGYPIPIPQGDLTPENISVDIHGRAKISLISFGRMLAGLPPNAAVTATIDSILSFRWMSPELVKDGSHPPSTESDMWAVGCVCFWILTRRGPYASVNRDELAGIDIMRGHPPATLADVFYRSTWITNGLWNAIGRCWRQDPLQRPNATTFLRLLFHLEGREIPWLPVDVNDLAGKLKYSSARHQQNNPTPKCRFVWKRFSRTSSEILEEVNIEIALYEATYVPKWYSKATPVGLKVVVKAGSESESSARTREALYSMTQHEIALVAQIDHPCIQRLLGIDSSATHTHMPDMVFESLSQVTLAHVLNFNCYLAQLREVASAITYLHGHINGGIAHGDIQPMNIFILPGGKVKLVNFTCAFQYISGQPTSTRQFQYMSRLNGGSSPLDLQGVLADCDARIHEILRTTLVLDPSNRPSASTVLTKLSELS
ncbi:kinase domain protein [Rhizoctonia solani AG-3 Rhs1AP]|uniref:Kinase domain protein n=2 Tax=Rhizoctonia solani AG-3 TaxID=1086053 RepID=A0A074RT79_9AGAM|nr:kinase domain protein [Rhizoctonia solani AG-3 Rhs1AP]KEP50291.1 kinase domain protein [Rhizoctonia solani 123E]